MNKEQKIPETLDEAVYEMMKMIRMEDQKRIQEGKLDAVSGGHMGVGRHIRNSWGLWSGSKLRDWFFERGIQHAKDMSGIILKKFQAVLRQESFDLESEIEHYRNYWIELGTDPDKIAIGDLKDS